MKLGFIGLGKMGSRMATKLLQEGHDVVVWNRSPQAVEELKAQISKLKTTAQNLETAGTIQELVQSLQKPRIIWLMVPAGEVTEKVLLEVKKYIEAGDTVIDGGNANYKNTQARYEKLKTKNIQFLGIGVSGGIVAGKNGYPLMVGGDKNAYEHIIPILDSLAKPAGGHEYFGTGGAGHFVKMVHNGIEYGLMQSIAEGFGVLEKAGYNFDLIKIAKLWQKGTLVSGFFMDRTVEALQRDPGLTTIVGQIGSATGETVWMVEEAKKQGVAVDIIEASLEFRKRSQTDTRVQHSFAARLVSAIRNAFGGHEVKKK